MNTDWKTIIISKLTSRKLWVGIAGLVTGIMLYRGATPESVESIGSLIMMGASVLGYLLAEGLVDSNRDD